MCIEITRHPSNECTRQALGNRWAWPPHLRRKHHTAEDKLAVESWAKQAVKSTVGHSQMTFSVLPREGAGLILLAT